MRRWDNHKRCFAYCGDDRCNCSASPFHPDNAVFRQPVPKPKQDKPKDPPK